MLRLRDIMTTDVLVLGPEMTLQSAMDVLSSGHISGAPVVAGRRVVGVVSSNDLLSLAAELRGRPASWRDVAEDDESPDDPLEGSEPPGAFFHEFWNNAGAGTNDGTLDMDRGEWNILEGHVVAQAMNRIVFSLPSSTPVEIAADHMRDHDVHRVLVMDDDQLVGIVTTTDIADAVADHKLTGRTWVFGKR